jgi:hypothetical protein
MPAPDERTELDEAQLAQVIRDVVGSSPAHRSYADEQLLTMYAGYIAPIQAGFALGRSRAGEGGYRHDCEQWRSDAVCCASCGEHWNQSLATAKMDGAREALRRLVAERMFPQVSRMQIDHFAEVEYGLYPKPIPNVVRLSDGSTVWRLPDGAFGRGKSIEDGWEDIAEQWPDILNRPADTGADFDALKAFAAALSRPESGEGR